MSVQVHSHRSLNRIYSKDKVSVPATLPVFMKYFCKFVLFYKPLNFFNEVQTWLQQLLQRLEESSIREKNISVEQLSMVLQQFEKEWDEDHVADRSQILTNRGDDDYVVDPDVVEAPRELPTPQFDKICVDFVREAVRYGPSELIKFAQRYFKALEAGKVEKYLQKMADQRAKLLPARLCSEDDLARAQTYLLERHGGGDDEAADGVFADLGADRGATIKMIQRTLAQEQGERAARTAAARAEADEAHATRKQEAAARQAEVEARLRDNNIDLDEHLAEAQRERAEEQERRRRELEDDDEDEDGPAPSALKRASAAAAGGKRASAPVPHREEEEEGGDGARLLAAVEGRRGRGDDDDDDDEQEEQERAGAAAGAAEAEEEPSAHNDDGDDDDEESRLLRAEEKSASRAHSGDGAAQNEDEEEEEEEAEE
jgi:hypothetical protein